MSRTRDLTWSPRGTIPATCYVLWLQPWKIALDSPHLLRWLGFSGRSVQCALQAWVCRRQGTFNKGASTRIGTMQYAVPVNTSGNTWGRIVKSIE